MNELKIFENPDFGQIRTVAIDGEPWFVGKDVAEVLGYKETAKAIREHVDADDKGGSVLDTPGGKQNMTIINESGLYSLILSSKLPNAKDFKRWVTSEVLPSIRKNGGYIAGQGQMTDSELMAAALMAAQRTIEDRDRRLSAAEQQIEQDCHKVLFADSVTASDSSILIGELAKLLRQNGVDIGQNRLFEWMRQNGYLCKARGEMYNTPTQRSMERGWFTIKETAINNPNGSTKITRTVKVTGKGQMYFINLFLA